MHITMFILKFLDLKKTSQNDQSDWRHLTWLSPNPLQSRTITTPATWVLSSCTTSSNRVKTPVKKSKRGTWGKIGETLIAANLLGRPLAKPEHNHSPPLSVPHLWTEDQISFPDMLQSRRRSGAHVRIIVLDHPMRARDQFGTNVYVPITTAQKSDERLKGVGG